jgi:hypothetical protein
MISFSVATFIPRQDAGDLTSQTKPPSLAGRGAFDARHLLALAFRLRRVLRLIGECQLREHFHHRHHATTKVGVGQSVAQLALV